MTDQDKLFAAALAVRANAYAPYSQFLVGAALTDEHGRIHVGANVENASYPEGICAETAAIAAMVAAGGRQVTAVALVGPGPDPCPPCGGCRQRLGEFAEPGTPIHLATPTGIERSVSLGELFPLGFGAQHLEG